MWRNGRLDLRSVRLYRGRAERVSNPNVRVVRGGGVLVHVGGQFVASG